MGVFLRTNAIPCASRQAVKNVYEKAGRCYKHVAKQNYRISPKLDKNQILKACSTSPGTSLA